MAAGTAPKPVVRDGKFYHVYNYGQPNERWVYVREAAGASGVAKGSSTSSLAATGPAKQALAPSGTATAPGLAKPGSGAPAADSGSTRVNPFLNADDLASVAQFNFDDTSARADIDKAIAELTSQTAVDKKQVDDSALRSSVGTTDDMIARGLFQSSIKDASLADIEKNRATQQGQLDTRLRLATADAATRKKALDDKKAAFDNAMALKAVENARPVNDASIAASTPSVSSGPSTPTPSLAARGIKPVVKNGKFYHLHADGRLEYIRPASTARK